MPKDLLRATVLTLAFLSVPVVAVSAQPAHPTPEDILKKCEANHLPEAGPWDAYATAVGDAQVHSFDHHKFYVLEQELRREGQRWQRLTTQRESLRPFPDGKPPPDASVQRSNVVVPFVGGYPSAALSHFVHPRLRIEEQSLHLRPKVAPAPTVVREAYTGFHLFGWMPHETQPLTAIIRESKIVRVRPERERVGEALCWVIEADGPRGVCTAWFDPDRGHALVQANIVKARPDDLLNWDRRLDQPMPRGSLPQQLADPRLPENQRAGTRAELRDIKLEQIGGRWLPVKGVLRSEETFKAGRPFKASKAITQRFDLAPDFVALGAFELDVPEGTRVFIGNGDEPQDGIRLEWRGGKVVPVADQEKLSRLEREISAYRKPRAGGAISNVP